VDRRHAVPEFLVQQQLLDQAAAAPAVLLGQRDADVAGGRELLVELGRVGLLAAERVLVALLLGADLAAAPFPHRLGEGVLLIGEAPGPAHICSRELRDRQARM
jgi:hypothetical protein